MLTSFPPVINDFSRILLLGTMPGKESLRMQQYYAHKTNQFWKILFTLFNFEPSTDYNIKKQFLLDNGIALWDVLASCERKGSLDSDIRNAVPNNFDDLFSRYPGIEYIFFTGKKAEQLYKRYVGYTLDKIYYTLPSPSPANARKNFLEKMGEWSILKEIL